MESARKRKASNATPSSSEAGTTKKLKLLNSQAAATPKPRVQEVGQKVVDQLRKAADKTESGRPIATEFLELPDRDDLPDYYEIIKLPIAIATIQDKVKKDAYSTVTNIESDLKRMIQNAKDYNDPNSQIYEDAEKIRKLVFNFMKNNNPAYTQQPHYQAFPTPIKSAPRNGTHPPKSTDNARVSQDASEKAARDTVPRGSVQSDRKPSVASSPTAGNVEGGGNKDVKMGDADLEFNGMTFQDAQQNIISHLIQFTDDEGLEIYTPFVNLPSRKLEDYYRLIRHPVSLKSIEKRARGQHGRNPPTDVTDFKLWDQFETEVSHIWRNAKEYNEDGSDMYNLATDFEKHFRSLLDDAKAKVDEPSSAPKIKLGGPKPKVTLNLSQPRDSPTPGVTVDNEALIRQRQMVQASVNGQQQPSRASPAVNGTTPTPAAAAAARPSSSAHSGSPPAAAAAAVPVKPEKNATMSPAPTTALAARQQSNTNGIMPPPTLRPTSGSPAPTLQQQTSSYHFTALGLLPPPSQRSYPLESALLPQVKINTHPQLRTPQPAFNLTIPPHPTLSHQSSTFTLPTSHYFLQISPTISKQLSMGRPYKMFVSLNGTRLTQRDTQFHTDSGKRTHVYEGMLAPGVNRIEVEVVAAKQDGKDGGDAKGLDAEKVTVFVNMTR